MVMLQSCPGMSVYTQNLQIATKKVSSNRHAQPSVAGKLHTIYFLCELGNSQASKFCSKFCIWKALKNTWLSASTKY